MVDGKCVNNISLDKNKIYTQILSKLNTTKLNGCLGDIGDIGDINKFELSKVFIETLESNIETLS